ncbi:hypothetical protein PAHAL_9G151500 [Panicum hallii]|uniref:Uncharacterized protein n=1 Tax=Panicum hallii TaxID=206008 RepID=A0A2T8I199_9POAL|nr:hypothetical protein PAHAL_9G151500 [Panicum hallii]
MLSIIMMDLNKGCVCKCKCRNGRLLPKHRGCCCGGSFCFSCMHVNWPGVVL